MRLRRLVLVFGLWLLLLLGLRCRCGFGLQLGPIYMIARGTLKHSRAGLLSKRLDFSGERCRAAALIACHLH
jgi:hypothetical protein